MYWINQLIWGGLDWIFPPLYGGCNRVGFRWFPDCRRQVQIVPEPVCQTCGLPLPRSGQCTSCKVSIQHYEKMRSWLVFDGPIRNALHKLKYRRNMDLGDALAQHLDEYAKTLNWLIEMVVPVPLGKKRTKDRGYNQVGLVAMPLVAVNQWHYEPQTVIRSRETRSQVGLSLDERKLNVLGVFRANPGLVSGTIVLLLDDVATAGATLSACANALMVGGARSVFALTLARALPNQELNMYKYEKINLRRNL